MERSAMRGVLSWISLRFIRATVAYSRPRSLQRSTAGPGRYSDLQQAQVAQFAAQVLRHAGGAGRGAVEVARRLLGGESAPAREGAERSRLHQHQLAVEHKAASSDAVLV